MGKLRVNYKFGARTKDLNEAQKALRRDYKKAYDRVRKYYERHSERMVTLTCRRCQRIRKS